MLKKLKRQVWNKRILYWWYRLWIRKDEFHPSLEIDVQAAMEMDNDEQDLYYKDIARRRRLAHKRTLK